MAKGQNPDSSAPSRSNSLQRLFDLERRLRFKRREENGASSVTTSAATSQTDLAPRGRRTNSRPPLSNETAIMKAERRKSDLPSLSISVPSSPRSYSFADSNQAQTPNRPSTAKAVSFSDFEDDGAALSDDSSICQSPSWEGYSQRKKKKKLTFRENGKPGRTLKKKQATNMSAAARTVSTDKLEGMRSSSQISDRPQTGEEESKPKSRGFLGNLRLQHGNVAAAQKLIENRRESHDTQRPQMDDLTRAPPPSQPYQPSSDFYASVQGQKPASIRSGTSSNAVSTSSSEKRPPLTVSNQTRGRSQSLISSTLSKLKGPSYCYYQPPPTAENNPEPPLPQSDAAAKVTNSNPTRAAHQHSKSEPSIKAPDNNISENRPPIPGRDSSNSFESPRDPPRNISKRPVETKESAKPEQDEIRGHRYMGNEVPRLYPSPKVSAAVRHPDQRSKRKLQEANMQAPDGIPMSSVERREAPRRDMGARPEVSQRQPNIQQDMESQLPSQGNHGASDVNLGAVRVNSPAPWQGISRASLYARSLKDHPATHGLVGGVSQQSLSTIAGSESSDIPAQDTQPQPTRSASNKSADYYTFISEAYAPPPLELRSPLDRVTDSLKAVRGEEGYQELSYDHLGIGPPPSGAPPALPARSARRGSVLAKDRVPLRSPKVSTPRPDSGVLGFEDLELAAESPIPDKLGHQSGQYFGPGSHTSRDSTERSNSSMSDDSPHSPSSIDTPDSSRPQSRKGLPANPGGESLRDMVAQLRMEDEDSRYSYDPTHDTHDYGAIQDDSWSRTVLPMDLDTGSVHSFSNMGGVTESPVTISSTPATHLETSRGHIEQENQRNSAVPPSRAGFAVRAHSDMDLPSTGFAPSHRHQPPQPKPHKAMTSSTSLPDPLRPDLSETEIVPTPPLRMRRNTRICSENLAGAAYLEEARKAVTAATNAGPPRAPRQQYKPRPSPTATRINPSLVGSEEPIAKIFVECCNCHFLHDLPSRVYECMARPDSVVEDKKLGVSAAITTMVKCPWCSHGMSTTCCAGYAATVFLKEKLHGK